MKVMKWSAIALAVSAGSTQFAVADAFVSDQAEAKGFIEDSSLDLLLRNYYFNRDGKSGSGDRVDWTQGFLTTYESGFTQGTVGFGVDAFGYLGLKLDGTSDKSGTGNLPVMNDGTPRDDYSRAGGAVKVRISKTMLKWGEMQPTAPVFAAGGSRLFPQTATGFQLQSANSKGSTSRQATSPRARSRPPSNRVANSMPPTQARPPRAPISLGAATQSPITSAPPCTAPNSKTSIASIT
ncbi:basic amino acid, basic peptide and imipenem outer membrane porin OprD precursor [Pseudomonas aeruginosa NCMG1179]|nr:basic amino acid, basic peptide and imipenem outer membrane porin OprD precursor [Pseudomonas aeruginosa NCMG1179]